VQLTEAQKEQIRIFQKSGDVMKAQGVILTELESRYKGTAEAVSSSANRLWNELGEAAEEIGKVFGPSISVLTVGVTQVLRAIREISTYAVNDFSNDMSKVFGGVAADAERAAQAIDKVTAAMKRNLPSGESPIGKMMREERERQEAAKAAMQEYFDAGTSEAQRFFDSTRTPIEKMREDLEASLETSAMFQQTGGDPWKVLNTVPQSGNPQTLQNWNRAQGMAANTAVAQSALGEINQFKVDVEKLPNRVRAAQIRAMPVGQDGRPSAAQLQALQDAQAEQMEKRIVNRTQLKQMAEGYSAKGMRPSLKFDEEGNVTGMAVEPPLASTVNQPADIRIVTAIQEAEAKATEAEAMGNSQQASYWRTQADLIKRTQPRMSELAGVAKVRADTLRSQINAINRTIQTAGAKQIPDLMKQQAELQRQLEELVRASEGGTTRQASPDTSGIPTVTTKQQFDSLPRGEIYIGKDGQTYRKP